VTERHSKQPRYAAAAWASFMVFMAAAYLGGVAVLLRAKAYFGWPANRPVSGWGEVLAIFGVTLLYIVVCTYAASICWLIFARFVFSWREATMVLCYGPTTRFDRWLLKTIVPGGPHDSESQAAALPSNNRWRGP
jgi:hypothetical protein